LNFQILILAADILALTNFILHFINIQTYIFDFFTVYFLLILVHKAPICLPGLVNVKRAAEPQLNNEMCSRSEQLTMQFCNFILFHFPESVAGNVIIILSSPARRA